MPILICTGTDYPNWGQATVVSDVQIAGNNTLKFAGLNYQGIQLASSQNVSGMEYLHLDFWTANSTTSKYISDKPRTGGKGIYTDCADNRLVKC